jgi:hypothetical protein
MRAGERRSSTQRLARSAPARTSAHFPAVPRDVKQAALGGFVAAPLPESRMAEIVALSRTGERSLTTRRGMGLLGRQMDVRIRRRCSRQPFGRKRNCSQERPACGCRDQLRPTIGLVRLIHLASTRPRLLARSPLRLSARVFRISTNSHHGRGGRRRAQEAQQNP